MQDSIKEEVGLAELARSGIFGTHNYQRIRKFVIEGVAGKKLKAHNDKSPFKPNGNRLRIKISDAKEFKRHLQKHGF